MTPSLFDLTIKLIVFRLQAAQIISILKFIIILCVLASFNPFPFLGVETPAWAAWMLENKIYACMMTFFLCNAVETQVVKLPNDLDVHLLNCFS